VEPGSPCSGESQQGQVDLHRTIQGLIPPSKSLLGKPGWLDATHTEGHEGNLLVGTRKCQLLAIPFVTLSLALFSLGGTDPMGGRGFPSNPELCRPLSNCGARLGYGYRIL
jgi:hypothetical protein